MEEGWLSIVAAGLQGPLEIFIHHRLPGNSVGLPALGQRRSPPSRDPHLRRDLRRRLTKALLPGKFFHKVSKLLTKPYVGGSDGGFGGGFGGVDDGVGDGLGGGTVAGAAAGALGGTTGGTGGGTFFPKGKPPGTGDPEGR